MIKPSPPAIVPMSVSPHPTPPLSPSISPTPPSRVSRPVTLCLVPSCSPAPPAPSSRSLAARSQAHRPVPSIMVHPFPHPDEIVRPAAGLHIQGYYVVFHGRQCGIYYNWYVGFTLKILMY
jgi:hypothetical protein